MTDAVEKVAVFVWGYARSVEGVEIGGDLGHRGRPIVAGASRKRREQELVRWTDGSERQGLEVLYNGGEMEFVARTGKPSEPHAFKAVVNLEVCKTHLDALTFVP